MAIVKYCDRNNTPQAVDVTDGSVHVLFTDSSGEALGIDSSTRALTIIDYEHHEVHAGSHFFYSDPVELDSAVAQDYMLTTPDTTKWIHLIFSATGSVITQVQLYEAGNRTGTTEQTVRNSNRNSLATAGMIIHKGQSGGTTDETLIWSMKSGSAAGASRTPMTSERGNEIILRQNTKYIIRITSGTNDNLINLQLEWYEHTNK